ncbi:MAG: hypothetical protein KF883_14245 [Thermomicrobiales bacterium]|nr:hypothetical protein [Thermomicrobiales bacterium]
MVQRGFYGGIVSEERKATHAPGAPGASVSPQRPGQTPDHTDLRGQVVDASPFQAGPARRPLTQYGTAQEISNLLPAPDEAAQPADFEQSPASFQEQRKALPWQNPPVRPTSAFAFDQGISPTPPALPANEAAALAESSAVEG